ncbi:MAG TPA: M23 family metallopeptidase [Acidimicrobiales bacterium]|jgi:murein DD-endopeptidase MepM/ murein hydrolase activator NlpD|nr:M23 family metallopeptidase [Acidimicrobiales bacterium]
MKTAARRLALIVVLLVAAGAGSSTYTLKWGDTLGGLARKFGVPVEAITSANAIENPHKVREGTKLVIPDKSAAQVAVARPIASSTPARAAAGGGLKVHKVAPGETLGSIAKRYKVTVDELKKLNDIKDERRVRDGRELTLPDSAEGAASAGSASEQAKADRPQPVCPVQNAGKFDFSNSFGAPRHGGRNHAGNDIFAKRGTPVLASVDGTLRRADGARAGIAYYIDGDDGTTYYGSHLDSISVSGGRVERGQKIGTVGTTGNAKGTPPHLHFEVKPGGGASIDPYGYLRAWCRGSGA